MISPEELLAALQQLPPDQVANIFANAQGHGRSPIRERQLEDLTPKPSARDPRPTFYADTDGREFHPITHRPYPKLLWHMQSGQEITVRDEAEEKARGPMWTSTAPLAPSRTPEEQARELFESLSPEDQEFILEHQRQQKLEAVKRMMAGLTEAQSAAIFALAK